MTEHAGRCQRTVTTIASGGTWMAVLTQAFVVLAIALLPVQMRAGADEAHPHSLLQLLVDASDGAIDHHHGEERGSAHAIDPRAPSGTACTSDPDLPSLGETGRTGGGFSISSPPTILLAIPSSGPELIWPPLPSWQGCAQMVESPPPRVRLL